MAAIVHLMCTLLLKKSSVIIFGMGNEQRWLSLDGICSTLRLNAAQVRTLVKKGCLVRIGGKRGVPARFLEPTAEYKEQLRIAAIFHMKHYTVPEGITEKAILSSGEIGAILGLNWRQTDKWLRKHHLRPAVRITKILHLYTVNEVRDALLRRAKRVNASRRAPFLLTEIIDFLRSTHAVDLETIPTDSALYQDDLLRKKLERLADLSEGAKAEFTAKVELARRIVQILESANEPRA